jgi:hypothetical protein
MATTNPRAALDVSRRNFLRLCAAASGASLVSLDPRAALAAEPKRGGTLRVGFYIEAATMDPHLSGSKIDRQVYHNIYEPLVTLDVEARHQARAGRVVAAARFEDGRLQAAPGRQVPRRHRLQRRERRRFNFNRMKTSRSRSARARSPASIRSTSSTATRSRST